MSSTETYNRLGECKIEATGEDARHIIELLEAEKDGRLVLTDVKPKECHFCGLNSQLTEALRMCVKELAKVTEERDKLRDGIKKIMQMDKAERMN